MKFKKIVGFGDSWVYGDELLDPSLAENYPDAHCCWTQNNDYRESRCFLGLLKDHYKLPVENLGHPGGSLQSTIWSYLWWFQQEKNPDECLVIVFLTEPDRESFYNPNHVHYGNDPQWNKFVHLTWVQSGASVVTKEWVDLVKRYTVLTHCDQLSQLRYIQAMMFFDGQASRYNIPLLQYHGAPPLTDFNVTTLMKPEFDWITYFRDHPGNQKRELIKPNGHPNENGHEIIRDMLITEIDSVIMSK